MFEVGQKVEVRQNVKNIGPCWVHGIYRGVVPDSENHAVYIPDGPSIVHVLAESIRPSVN